LDQLAKFRLHIVQKRLLMQEIVERIAGDTELRKDHQRDTLRIALAGQTQRLREVESGVCHFAARLTGHHPDKALVIGREKIANRRGAC
jgi:hypothetical protein